MGRDTSHQRGLGKDMMGAALTALNASTPFRPYRQFALMFTDG